MGPESTHCRARSISVTPEWGEVERGSGGVSLRRSRTRSIAAVAMRAASHAAMPPPTLAAIRTRRSSVRLGGAARRHTRWKLRRGQGGSRLLEAVVAVEELVADGDGRNASHPSVVRILGRLSELILHRLGLDRLEHRLRMELTG